MTNIYSFFEEILAQSSIKEISLYLALNTNTVKRWIENKSVPPQYYFDLCRYAGIGVDYSKFSEKEKDQFYSLSVDKNRFRKKQIRGCTKALPDSSHEVSMGQPGGKELKVCL